MKKLERKKKKEERNQKEEGEKDQWRRTKWYRGGELEHRITRQQRNAPSVGYYIEVNKNLRLGKLQKY